MTEAHATAAELREIAYRLLDIPPEYIVQVKDVAPLARHVLATVRADDDARLSPEALRAMGASGGPREFWLTLNHEWPPINDTRIEVDFNENEAWTVWAKDSTSDVVCLAINPTVAQLRGLCRVLSIPLPDSLITS